MDVAVLILAAGKGIRMNSDLPKVYHSICGKPLIAWVVEAVQKAGFNNIYVIVGYKGDLVKSACEKYKVGFVWQKEQLGTGHAVMQAHSALKEFKGITLVLNGDAPLIRSETIRALIKFHDQKKAAATILTADIEKPSHYGRIIRDDNGDVTGIIEQKDASDEQLKIKEINSGTYCFDNQTLFKVLPKLKSENAQKEYYLTDVIGMLKSSHLPVCAYKTKNANEILGVNTKEELAGLEELCKSGS